MEEPTLTRRVEVLEEQIHLVASLPGRLSALESHVAALREEMLTGFAALREEMRAGDEETRRQMRILHEEVIDRIKTLGESLEGRPRKPRRR